MPIQDLQSPRELGQILKSAAPERLVAAVFDAAGSRSYEPFRKTLEDVMAKREGLDVLFLDVRNPEAAALARQMRMQTLPTTLLFKGGEAVDTVEGMLDEAGLLSVLGPYLPPPPAAQSLQEELDAALAGEEWERALALLPLLRQEKKEDRGLWLLQLRLLWRLGRLEEAREALPTLDTAAVAQERENIGLLLQEASEMEPCGNEKWDRVRALLRGDDLQSLCDALLEFVAADRKYGEDLARKVLLGVLALLGDNPLVPAVRARLLNILFI